MNQVTDIKISRVALGIQSSENPSAGAPSRYWGVDEHDGDLPSGVELSEMLGRLLNGFRDHADVVQLAVLFEAEGIPGKQLNRRARLPFANPASDLASLMDQVIVDCRDDAAKVPKHEVQARSTGTTTRRAVVHQTRIQEPMSRRPQDEEADVFISHASEDKEEFVRGLAEAIRGAGISVWYDEYTLKWGSSLSGSIDKGLAKCKRAIVVLSPSFFAKNWPQIELNALVGRRGSGDRELILPIFHQITANEVRKHSPILADLVAKHSTDDFAKIIAELRDSLDLEVLAIQDSPSQRNQTLAASLADQVNTSPRIVSDSGLWVMLHNQFLKTKSVNQTGGIIELDIPTHDSSSQSSMRNLSRLSEQIGFAHGSDAQIVQIIDTKSATTVDGQVWSVKLKVVDSLDGKSSHEAGTTGYTADQIAELRTRRILLNERPVRLRDGTQAPMATEEMLLMALISGISTPGQIERGVLPDLAQEIDTEGADFLPVARLLAVFKLRTTNAVESIEKLALEQIDKTHVRVSFRGTRAKVYSNVDPPRISVEGVCDLDS